MRDDEWLEAYNAGRAEANSIISELLRCLADFVASSDFDEHLDRNQRCLRAIANAKGE